MRFALTWLPAFTIAQMICSQAKDLYHENCCGNDDLTSTYFTLPPPNITWTFDTTYDDNSISVLQAKRLSELVGAETNGRFKIDIKPNRGAGGFGRVSRGEDNMGTAYLSAFGTAFNTNDPLLSWDSVPVPVTGNKHNVVDDAVRRWTSEIEPQFRQLYSSVAPPSTMLLGGLPSAGQGFFINKNFSSLREFENARLRCYSSWTGKMSRALNMSCGYCMLNEAGNTDCTIPYNETGAKGTRIYQNQIVDAFRSGSIHGLWGSADTVIAKELWNEDIKTFIAMRSFYPFIYTIVHKASYEELDMDAKLAFRNAWAHVFANTTSVVRERETEGDNILTQNGIQIVTADDPRISNTIDKISNDIYEEWKFG